MMSGILSPLIKSKSAAELGRHACKPGLKLPWLYIISYFLLVTTIFGSIVTLQVTQMEDNHQGFKLASIAMVALLGLLSHSAGMICGAVWMEDFCKECELAAKENPLLAKHANYLLDRFTLISKIMGPAFCVVFSHLQLMSILAIYNAISGKY